MNGKRRRKIFDTGATVIAVAIAGSFTVAIGLMTGAASPMECSEYEVLPLPGEVQEV